MFNHYIQEYIQPPKLIFLLLNVHQLFFSHHPKSFLCAPKSFITSKIILRCTKVFYHPPKLLLLFLKMKMILGGVMKDFSVH
jgi:hypothetical protein